MDVAIRDAMVAAAVGPTRTLESIGVLGASTVELEVGEDFTAPAFHGDDGAPLNARAIATELRSRGVRVSALLVANDFASASAGGDDQVTWVVDTVDFASELHVRAVRIDPLARDKTTAPADAAERFVRGVRQVLEQTRGSTIDLGIENHGPIANDPAWVDTVVGELDDPRVGLTLDTGNFYWYGFPLDQLYGLIEKYAPRAKHTHIKSINFPPEAANRRREIGWEYKQYCCALDEGNLDLRRVVRILRDAGYDRDLCIENESLFKHPPEAKLDVLLRDVRALREAMDTV